MKKGPGRKLGALLVFQASPLTPTHPHAPLSLRERDGVRVRVPVLLPGEPYSAFFSPTEAEGVRVCSEGAPGLAGM
jgi:hypothetical protein